MTGVFDMRNFGDLLFPLVASWRLAPGGYEVTPVAPTASGGGVCDSMAPVALQDMLAGPAAAAGILIGGGYIIHAHRMDMIEDYARAGVADWAGSGLWLGATLAAAVADAPLAWNAPGAPHPLPRALRPVADAALQAADYVSLRDRGSVELLQAPGDVAVEVVPDTICDLARMWPPRLLAEPYSRLMARKGADAGARYLALCLRNRSLGAVRPSEVAALIEAFARAHKLVPLLVALGRAHRDEELAREVASSLTGPVVLLDDARSLAEISAALAHARLCIGASLHGYIAAVAYGVPAVLVAKPAYRKFSGLLEQTGGREDLAADWPAAFGRGAARLSDRRRTGFPDRVFTALDAHWERIAAAFSSPSTRREARREFLRASLRTGVERNGPRWALGPFLPRTVRGPELRP